MSSCQGELPEKKFDVRATDQDGNVLVDETVAMLKEMGADTDNLSARVDLSISKTDGQLSVGQGSSITYAIVVSNAGPGDAEGVTVVDAVPTLVEGATWTCSGSGGGTCTASGSGDIDDGYLAIQCAELGELNVQLFRAARHDLHGVGDSGSPRPAGA